MNVHGEKGKVVNVDLSNSDIFGGGSRGKAIREEVITKCIGDNNLREHELDRSSK